MATHRPGRATPSPPAACVAARLAHALASRARARTAPRARICPAPPPHLPAPPLAALAPPRYCCPVVRARTMPPLPTAATSVAAAARPLPRLCSGQAAARRHSSRARRRPAAPAPPPASSGDRPLCYGLAPPHPPASNRTLRP
nr:atherin-like [Aegilops tauschii subsp. strangulata]